MCLSSVTKEITKPTDFVQDGWKSFSGGGSGMMFENYSLKGSKYITRDKWIQADTVTIKAGNGQTYNTGFHVWLDEKDVDSYKKNNRTRVFIRKVTYIGDQGGKCAIALEMYVPSDPNGWPPKDDTPVSPIQPPPTKPSTIDKIRQAANKVAGKA